MSVIHKFCEKLGANNKPIYTVLAIACGKGTVRPILSITDKKEAPDARKYAALRELMTEFIGVPTTVALGLAGEGIASLLTRKGTTRYKNAASFLSFLGICAAAGYFVPKFCNIGMPPIMKRLMPDYDPNALHSDSALSKKLDMVSSEPEIYAKEMINSKTYTDSSRYIYRINNNSPYFRAGMRV